MQRKSIKLGITISILLVIGIQYAWSLDAVTKRRLAISAAIFPRIVGVDMDIRQKLDAENNAELLIIYSRNKNIADNVTTSIHSKVKDISGIAVRLKVENAKEVGTRNVKQAAGIFISEQLDSSELIRIMKLCKENSRICFSPYPGDVEAGIATGIHIGSQIKPFFNLGTLRASGIRINPVLLKVAKTHE